MNLPFIGAHDFVQSTEMAHEFCKEQRAPIAQNRAILATILMEYFQWTGVLHSRHEHYRPRLIDGQFVRPQFDAAETRSVEIIQNLTDKYQI